MGRAGGGRGRAFQLDGANSDPEFILSISARWSGKELACAYYVHTNNDDDDDNNDNDDDDDDDDDDDGDDGDDKKDDVTTTTTLVKIWATPPRCPLPPPPPPPLHPHPHPHPHPLTRPHSHPTLPLYSLYSLLVIRSYGHATRHVRNATR
uniref:Uncharacterized protein n=1 Tax=Vespula pensylvanica TaxID=30213 RepID=A0A834PDM7_VESPE|nr:hypothetical protein H0235_000234 [Vespula pensylvanica]